MTTPADPATPQRSRRQAWILVVLFFVPLLAAFVLYYGVSGWRPAGRTNKGDLIHPARPLPTDVALTAGGAANDKALDADLLRDGKWTLLYVGGGSCDARCHEALTLIRQTRLALNDDAARVQRLFMVTQPCCDLSYLDTEHAGLTLASADDTPGKTLLNVFPKYGGEPVETAGRIYIVDPLGNLMMSYAPQAGRKDLLEDLKKLLKLSHIG